VNKRNKKNNINIPTIPIFSTTIPKANKLTPNKRSTFLLNRNYYINGIYTDEGNIYCKMDWKHSFLVDRGVMCGICRANPAITHGRYIDTPATSVSISKTNNHFITRKHQLSRKWFIHKNKSQRESLNYDDEGKYDDELNSIYRSGATINNNSRLRKHTNITINNNKNNWIYGAPITPNVCYIYYIFEYIF